MTQGIDFQERLAFLRQEWPDIDYGPGHVVFADGNYADQDIQVCLDIAHAVLRAQKDGIMPANSFLKDMVPLYVDVAREELLETIALLSLLLGIPEHERFPDEDDEDD